MMNKAKKAGKTFELMVAVTGIVVGIFFLSNNITGNVIGNTTNSTSNFIGAGCLIIGLVAGFFWVLEKIN